MDKSILVVSTQYPSYGGASTNAYAIIKYLRQNNYNVIGVFIENDDDIDVDPENMGNIYHFKLYPFQYGMTNKILEYRKIINAVGNRAPSIILCKNYLSPIYSKILYPNSKIIYLVSGLCNAIEICTQTPTNLIISNNIKLCQSKNEIRAINNSDLIVINSMITFTIFNTSYGEYKNKLYPKIVDTSQYASILIDDGANNNNKIYDFIIVASILTRKEKNNEFLIQILKNPLFDQYSKLIVGNNNINFFDIPNATIYDSLPHNTLMNLMNRSKILLYPSLYDSNSNTIREAVYNKCLILMSNNIGFYESFPDFSICKTYELEEWINKSIYLVNNYDTIVKNYNIDFGSDEHILLDLVDYLLDKSAINQSSIIKHQSSIINHKS